MKSLFRVTLFILCSSILLQAQNGTKNFIDQPFIEVTGTKKLEITPDEIYLDIQFNEDKYRGKMDIEKQEQQLIKALISIGIDPNKNLSVRDYDGIYQHKFFGKDEVSKIKKYELIVCDGEELNKVYAIANEINISNILITRVSHSEIEKLKRQNKIEALKKAKNKASDYALAIDQKIGNAIYIHENETSTHSNYNNVIANSSSTYKLESKGIFQSPDFQKIILSASISVKFKLI